MTKGVEDRPQATTYATTRANATEENVKVLQGELFKQEKDVSLQITELSAVNARIAALTQDVHIASTNLTTKRTAAWEASTAVFEIQDAVTNRTRDFNDAVRNSVTAAFVSRDEIRISTN